jgi:hypothetical protein
MKRLLYLAIPLAAVLGLAACIDRLASGGDATETGNARVSGVVLGEDSLPVAGAEVMILPVDFDPLAEDGPIPDSLKTTTDKDGSYHFPKLAQGDYNVLARDAAARRRLAIWGLRLGASELKVPTDTLHTPGGLSVPLPETSDSGSGWISVPGTTLRVRLDSEQRLACKVNLDSVPAGIVPKLVYAKAPGLPPLVIAKSVVVRKAQVTAVDAYAQWPYSRKLMLNTAAAPTALSRDLRDFPLLVRLEAPAFDFSQAGPGGTDLRFSSVDGTPLAHAIESWDSAAGSAAVWVRLDTLRAGKADQYITLHWGYSPAAGPRRTRAVFDTLAGFAGVWHLGETYSGSNLGLYKDATGAGSDGDGHILNVSRAGVIGAGRGLDSGDYIVSQRPSNGLRPGTAFTLSAWFRATSPKIGLLGGELASVGDNYGFRVQRDSALEIWYWSPKLPTGPAPAWNNLNVKVPGILDGQWHLAEGVFDGSSLRLYCDGREVGARPMTDSLGQPYMMNVTLGKHGFGKPGFEFAGNLDEVEVHSVARDADWTKMVFANQKPGSVFPAFGP